MCSGSGNTGPCACTPCLETTAILNSVGNAVLALCWLLGYMATPSSSTSMVVLCFLDFEGRRLGRGGTVASCPAVGTVDAVVLVLSAVVDEVSSGMA